MVWKYLPIFEFSNLSILLSPSRISRKYKDASSYLLFSHLALIMYHEYQ
jgi:hypothetical protein